MKGGWVLGIGMKVGLSEPFLIIDLNLMVKRNLKCGYCLFFAHFFAFFYSYMHICVPSLTWSCSNSVIHSYTHMNVDLHKYFN